MRWFLFAVVCAGMLIVPASAVAGNLSGATVVGTNPKFPTPFATAILGLSLTAVAVIGARVVTRSPNIMMYMVLGCVALTAVMVAYSDKLYREFHAEGQARAQQLAADPGARSQK